MKKKKVKIKPKPKPSKQELDEEYIRLLTQHGDGP